MPLADDETIKEMERMELKLNEEFKKFKQHGGALASQINAVEAATLTAEVDANLF